MEHPFALHTSDNPKPSDGLPSIVYKYRCWSNTWHKKILTDNEIHFASADEFNDPFDSKFHVRYDLTSDEELLTRIEASARGAFPGANDEFIAGKVREAFGNMRNEEYVDDFNERKYIENNKVIGVLSLTGNPDNILMWSHYSENHRGFTVGFDVDCLHASLGGTIHLVNYQDEYPKILPALGLRGDAAIRELIEMYGTKSSLWSYEQEVRIFKMNAAKKNIKYNNDCLREIILGCKISDKDKAEILEVAKGFPHVKVYQAYMSKRAFALDIKPIL